MQIYSMPCQENIDTIFVVVCPPVVEKLYWSKSGYRRKNHDFVEISTFYHRLDQFSENVNGGGILCWKTCLLNALICPKSKYGVCQIQFWASTPYFDKSKMAATEGRKSISRHIFCAKQDKNTNETLFHMFSGIRNSIAILFTT